MSVCARKTKRKIERGRGWERGSKMSKNLAMSAGRLLLVPPGHAAMWVTLFLGCEVRVVMVVVVVVLGALVVKVVIVIAIVG
jgi:hypothetical protein